MFKSPNIRDTRYFLYQYNDKNFRFVKIKSCRLPGWESTTNDKSHFVPRVTPDDEIDRVSLSRSRRMIRELALCNDFEYFATLTINSVNCDRFSLTACQDLLRKKLKKLKRINKNFAYIFITEKHKNGAFHFHGLIKGVTDFYINDNGYLSHSLFDELGFNSFSKIRDYTKTCNYILKYITKDCVRNEKGTIYISSRGLKKAEKYEIKDLDIPYDFDNDYCSIKDYEIDKIPDEIKLKLLTL